MKTVYRILAPIISIAILPVLYFLPMFRIMITSGLNTGDTKTNLLTSLAGVREFISFHDVTGMAKGSGKTLDVIKNLLGNLDEETKQKILGDSHCTEFLIAAGVFLAVFILLTLAFAVVSAATKKHLPSLCISLASFVSLLVCNGCFKAFAKPFLNGSIGLSSLFNSGNAQLGALLGRLVSVDYLQLSLGYTFALFITIVLIIGTVCIIFEEKYAKN